MNRIRLAPVACCLVAWAICPAQAILCGPSESRAPASATDREPLVRFEINHSCTGMPGPRISPDGKLTVLVSRDLEASIVAVPSGMPVGAPLRHSPRREGMRIHTWAFSADGRLLATASSEGDDEDTVGEVRVWEVPTGKLLAVATDAYYDLGRVHTVAFAADNRTVKVHCEEISGK